MLPIPKEDILARGMYAQRTTNFFESPRAKVQNMHNGQGVCFVCIPLAKDRQTCLVAFLNVCYF